MREETLPSPTMQQESGNIHQVVSRSISDTQKKKQIQVTQEKEGGMYMILAATYFQERQRGEHREHDRTQSSGGLAEVGGPKAAE